MLPIVFAEISALVIGMNEMATVLRVLCVSTNTLLVCQVSILMKAGSTYRMHSVDPEGLEARTLLTP